VTQQSFMGGVGGINPRRRHIPSATSYTLAAKLQGTPAGEKDKDKDKDTKDDAEKKKDDAAKKADTPKPAEIRVIAIADLDLISEQFFEIRRRKIENYDFDNVTFVLNCVDSLAGDESFINLRKRRLEHRTLLTLEDQVSKFDRQRQTETKAAEDAADEQLKLAQQRLDKQVKEVQDRKDMDERTKEIMLANLQEVANRRLDVEKAKIEDEKRRKVQESKGEMERKVREIELGIKSFAILFPPLPALLLGVVVAWVRLGRENRGANPTRLA
jgi:ABC-2 type transport system permease protein